MPSLGGSGGGAFIICAGVTGAVFGGAVTIGAGVGGAAAVDAGGGTEVGSARAAGAGSAILGSGGGTSDCVPAGGGLATDDKVTMTLPLAVGRRMPGISRVGALGRLTVPLGVGGGVGFLGSGGLSGIVS